jgi:GT2 family glycosyltransferase
VTQSPARSRTISHLTEVSVVVPTRNRPELIQRCLLALVSSEVLPAEVVVVDQSPYHQPQPEVLEAFRARSVGLRWIMQEGTGVSRSRNAGVRNARGGLLAFTDDDCVPESGWLASLVAATSHPVTAVSGRVAPLPSLDSSAVALSSRTSTERAVYRGTGPHVPWEVGTGGNLLVRRDGFERAGGFDEALGPGSAGRGAEDIELIYRLLAMGGVIAYEPAATVLHQQATRRLRVRRRAGYGYGMGFFLGSYARAGDNRAWALSAIYLRRQAAKFVRACVHRDFWSASEALTSLGAAGRGFPTGMRHVPLAFPSRTSRAPLP